MVFCTRRGARSPGSSFLSCEPAQSKVGVDLLELAPAVDPWLAGLADPAGVRVCQARLVSEARLVQHRARHVVEVLLRPLLAHVPRGGVLLVVEEEVAGGAVPLRTQARHTRTQ